MLFNSYAFIFCFLPLTLLIFFNLSKFHLTKLSIVWLVITSLIFYSQWSISYLPLLLISILFNYQISHFIASAQSKSQRAKILLTIGILFNLGLLGYYKYAGFLIDTIQRITHNSWSVPTIVLPIGISFYTFTQSAYLVDTYRGETKGYNFLTYCLFVTFFPHLIAGPILHHKDVIPQFYRLRNLIFSYKNMFVGLSFFILGLGKKLLIADPLSLWVDTLFKNANNLGCLEAWVAALSYTFQLYFDFSGYSDMAVGLGWMLNIELPINFDSPYKSISIIEFWRRWHITLSNFLRDYLYIPLGGNRRGKIRQYINLFTTMLLGGLWHGAGWTFIAWGALHGIYLVINHWWRKLQIPLPKFLSWIITFVAVVIGWVIFRSPHISDAKNMIMSMIGTRGIVLNNSYQLFEEWMNKFGVNLNGELPHLLINSTWILFVLVGLLLWVTLLPNTQQIVQRIRFSWYWATFLGCIAAFCLLSLNQVSVFLYFQF
ncbi:MBOAT family protein [Aetokthonos hydrillicola Thurmond2011]|jgi:alginate O-acetyltransferase complex protein AlgI|uniref:MBOAT family protein n=1 Tax=Aetokthonos hydrillicola Thurmond2011 TaxID=2712845 RepID=A0AAP5I4L7_9CYAN|nr:MBOAT family protein [Aetokthonos hydrillicola]MBO3457617.1 MBOAT family protein [Aetokthonos hydrillicola CCALA 1050]MBW4587895.1 MBOAT family protein [Aetokthonos hydrillicola CCALA 1050]MDR9894701.1 MBOAT family protein [Aetokthonos hydrillicola Thurmond2011]